MKTEALICTIDNQVQRTSQLRHPESYLFVIKEQILIGSKVSKHALASLYFETLFHSSLLPTKRLSLLDAFVRWYIPEPVHFIKDYLDACNSTFRPWCTSAVTPVLTVVKRLARASPLHHLCLTSHS